MAISTLKPPANLGKPELKPPRYLKKAGKQLWVSVASVFVLEQHDITLLTSLCETLDKKNRAEKELRKAGALTFTNRHGESKPHAAIAIIRDCNVLLARLRRELNLSEEPRDSRPPPLRYGGGKQ